MKYIDTELLFTPEEMLSKSLSPEGEMKSNVPPDLLGIRVRLGNQPLVYHLNKFRKTSGVPESADLAPDRDYYLVVHAISAVKTQGSARVDELQYFANALNPVNLQTVDLVPKTRFNEIIAANANLSGALDFSGQIFLDVPQALMDQLMPEQVKLAPGVDVQLSASAGFIGKLNYSVQMPVVQASGVGSNSCYWILRPNEKKQPLLGDQLLIQSVAVPVGTKYITYELSGVVKVDKGIFWKQRTQETPRYKIEVDLSC